MAADGGRCTCRRRRTSRPRSIRASTLSSTVGPAGPLTATAAGPIKKTAASVATIALAGVLVLPACGPTFQQMATAICADIATDTAYEHCRRRLAEQLAEERLGHIVRSQVVR